MALKKRGIRKERNQDDEQYDLARFCPMIQVELAPNDCLYASEVCHVVVVMGMSLTGGD